MSMTHAVHYVRDQLIAWRKSDSVPLTDTRLIWSRCRPLVNASKVFVAEVIDR